MTAMICHAPHTEAGIPPAYGKLYTPSDNNFRTPWMDWRKKDTGLGRREIATMLVALEKQAREASRLADKAHSHAHRPATGSPRTLSPGTADFDRHPRSPDGRS
jgi:hypothetical protein